MPPDIYHFKWYVRRIVNIFYVEQQNNHVSNVTHIRQGLMRNWGRLKINPDKM